MPHSRPIRPRISRFASRARDSYGSHLLDHLATDRTCLLGGQLTVVALLEVDANLP